MIKEYFEDKHQETNRKDIFVKNVPDTLLPLFGVVCNRFPELKNENIELRFQNIKTTMQAFPHFIPFFKKRRYVLGINNHPGFKGVTFDQVPFNAKVGLLAHEMCHILDYKHKSSLELIKTGIDYLFITTKVEYEKFIDKMVVEKGFGHQLKAWSHYVIYHSTASFEYKMFKKKTYLQPEEIDSLMKKVEENIIIKK